VPGRPPACPSKAALAEPVHLGAMISLAGATVNPQFSNSQSTGSSPTPVGRLQVSLCWESLAPAPLDYTVFVHLYDANGTLLATGDGPPMNGAFPTRLWQPGDVIADTHRLPLPAGNEDYRIGVGLYDPISGARLQAVQAGQPLPDDTVFLKVLP
jgi:hypothetical protein